ncbi:MAG: aldehyde dehydrogenase family protein, partial [Microvirgula sp.]
NRRLSQILASTHAGGVTLNDTMLHIAQDDLPFGGIGPSGMGSYHGRDGFDTFSHLKAVCAQARLNGTGLIRPPYGRAVNALLRFMLR